LKRRSETGRCETFEWPFVKRTVAFLITHALPITGHKGKILGPSLKNWIIRESKTFSRHFLVTDHWRMPSNASNLRHSEIHSSDQPVLNYMSSIFHLNRSTFMIQRNGTINTMILKPPSQYHTTKSLMSHLFLHPSPTATLVHSTCMFSEIAALPKMQQSSLKSNLTCMKCAL
jgi:hypothetical protein